MSVAIAKLTVAEYEKLAPPKDGRWELRHGDLVKVTYPKFPHMMMQVRLQSLLGERAPRFGPAIMEFAFRAGPEYEIWAADVGMADPKRMAASQGADWFQGAPDLVIEVLSPSNTASEILDKEQVCLNNGCVEFWVIDQVRKTVRVTTVDRAPKTYFAGGLIPLDAIGGGTLAFSEIFEVTVDQQGAL